MRYSFDNTVLIWTNDKAVKALVKKTATSLGLQVFQAEQDTDLYGVPYFFAVLDAGKLDKESLAIWKEVLVYENPKEFTILLCNQPPVKIPGSIKKYFKAVEGDLSEASLRTMILNKQKAIKRHSQNKRSYDKIIFRTVYILRKLMQENTVLHIDDLCLEFNVSEKTIKRDIELLRSMGEEIVYDKSRGGYKLFYSNLIDK